MYDLEPDFDTSAQTRFELIGQMSVGTELMQLAANVKIMQQELQHGLYIRFDKGESDLVLPPHQCTSEKYKESAERPTTRLLTRFRNSLFIPNLGTGLLADISLNPALYGPQPRSDILRMSVDDASRFADALYAKNNPRKR